jgi:hypothetical protein
MCSKDLRTPDELDEFLTQLGQEGATQKNRLLVVQDLSTRMIEKLGTAFDIEPGFFRTHIGDYVWLNTRDPQAEIPDLKSPSIKSNHFSAVPITVCVLGLLVFASSMRNWWRAVKEGKNKRWARKEEVFRGGV